MNEIGKNHIVLDSMDLKTIAKVIENQNKTLNKSFLGLEGIEKVAESFSRQFAQYNYIGNSLNTSFKSVIKGPQFQENLKSLNKLNQNLSLQFNNKEVVEKIARFTLTGQRISEQLILASNSFNNSASQMNTVNVAFQGISKTILNDIAAFDTWEDLEEINRIQEEFEIPDTSQIDSTQDFEKLRESIISDLVEIFGKTQSQKVRAHIWNLMQLIAILLQFHSSLNPPKQQITKNYKITVSQNNDINLNDIKETLETTYNEKLNTYPIRIATTNVNLRISNKKRSKKIDLVKAGQTVKVLDIKHKWLHIIYFDFETKETKTGFVYKKYFQPL